MLFMARHKDNDSAQRVKDCAAYAELRDGYSHRAGPLRYSGCHTRSVQCCSCRRANSVVDEMFASGLRHASRSAAPWMSLLDDDAKIVTSRLGAGRFRVAGTAEINGENRDIRACRIAPLVDWVARYFPEVSTRQCIPWAGLRPMMPSMMPRVGPGRRQGVYYNTGHGHLGWTLSAATAELVAQSVAARV